MKRLFRGVSRISLILVLWAGSVFGFQTLNNLHVLPNMLTPEAHADGSINVWWPTDSAKVNDTQTFKAMVQDKNASDYTMTWTVDDGQPNSMYDSSTDYPHKEAVVDLKNWNWKGSGPYKVTFAATGKDGQSLGQTSVTIYTTAAALGPVTVEAGSTNPVQATTTSSNNQSSNPSVSPSPSVSSSPSPTPSSTITAIVFNALTGANIGQNNFSLSYPQDNATLKGTEYFKASVSNLNPTQYNVYWQVDNGQLNVFTNTSTAKEAKVDVSNWSWHKDGKYGLTFIAKDLSGKEIGKTSINVVINSGTVQVSNPLPSPTPSPVTDTLKVGTNSGSSILNGAKLYVNPYSSAAQAAKDRPQDATQLNKIAGNSTAIWLGNWSNISSDVGNAISAAKNQGSVPVFVAYNIPSRDCGQYSSGGSNSPDAYRSWISSIANAIGSNKAAVILEPDALALTSCLNSSQLSDRYQLLNDAVRTLKAKGNIAVYLDAGHPNWISADDMAGRLSKAGVSGSDGFALNVSNYFTTNDNVNYGSAISSKIGGKHFVIDTSRNGVGPTSDSQWCNPWGRALGNRPTTSTGNSLVDAYLWIKAPGESDGNCNGGPGAGNWWLDYALDLAKHAAF